MDMHLFLICLKAVHLEFSPERLARDHALFLSANTSDNSFVNQGFDLFFTLCFLRGACLFKMEEKVLVKNSKANSTSDISLVR